MTIIINNIISVDHYYFLIYFPCSFILIVLIIIFALL